MEWWEYLVVYWIIASFWNLTVVNNEDEDEDMGVDTQVYTYYGIKRDWDEECEKFTEIYSDDRDADDPHFLQECYSNDWLIFGIKLYDSGNFRWGDDLSGDDFKTFDTGKLWAQEAEYRKKFKEKFPQFTELINQPFELFSFIYYT